MTTIKLYHQKFHQFDTALTLTTPFCIATANILSSFDIVVKAIPCAWVGN